MAFSQAGEVCANRFNRNQNAAYPFLKGSHVSITGVDGLKYLQCGIQARPAVSQAKRQSKSSSER